MASIDTRVKKLEQKFAKLAADVKAQKAETAKLKKRCKDVEKWIKAEAAWSAQVTEMLRMVDWATLVVDYPSLPQSNPPQTPPDWPMA